MEEPIKLCLHCEAAPQQNFYRLCNKCASVKGLRIIYNRTSWYTDRWDAHIQTMVEKFKLRTPLGDNPDYGGDPNYDTPKHPRNPIKAKHNSMPRIVRMAGHP